MPSLEFIAEADRQLTVCNSCRYCEGFCAVFPAMELRRKFAQGDLVYLANLCHDCRDCYYACQFAPPHQFMVNVPLVFAQLRQDTYRDYTWPGVLRGLFSRGGLAVGVISAVATVLIVVLVLTLRGSGALFGVHTGTGAFYRVVPYLAMVLPASAMALYALWVFCLGTYRFWK